MEPSRLNTGMDEIEPSECLSLLGTETVGRLGFVLDGRPEIYPVNFAMVGESIEIHTEHGRKLTGAITGPVVFEVDHLDSENQTGWSVVIHGRAHVADGHLGHPARQTRVVRPWPRAIMPHVLRIVPESVTGRRIHTLGDAKTLA